VSKTVPEIIYSGNCKYIEMRTKSLGFHPSLRWNNFYCYTFESRDISRWTTALFSCEITLVCKHCKSFCGHIQHASIWDLHHGTSWSM